MVSHAARVKSGTLTSTIGWRHATHCVRGSGLHLHAPLSGQRDMPRWKVPGFSPYGLGAATT